MQIILRYRFTNKTSRCLQNIVKSAIICYNLFLRQSYVFCQNFTSVAFFPLKNLPYIMWRYEESSVLGHLGKSVLLCCQLLRSPLYECTLRHNYVIFCSPRLLRGIDIQLHALVEASASQNIILIPVRLSAETWYQWLWYSCLSVKCELVKLTPLIMNN